MSSEDITPEQDPTPEQSPGSQDPAPELREITVQVPAHRVAQFERFHQRFLAMAAHWDSQVGSEDLRSRRGRRGPGRRHGHGRCRRHGEAERTI
jgi:hypothetical protein